MENKDGYHVLKLVSGEELLSNVYFEESQVVLENPVTFTKVQESDTVYIKIKPWLELIENENLFIVTLDKIITMSKDVHDDLILIYNEYVDNYVIKHIEFMENILPISDVDDKMGYICTVDEARKQLDTIWNS